VRQRAAIERDVAGVQVPGIFRVEHRQRLGARDARRAEFLRQRIVQNLQRAREALRVVTLGDDAAASG
jgi:hypothetical protein